MKAKSKVVVIGGSGFVGSHVADALTDAGYQVTLFDKNESRWARKEQKMLQGDVLVFEQVLNAVKQADYVYHLAGIANIWEAASQPMQTIETNIIGSTNVFEACVQAKVKRLIFASSIYVFSHKGSFYRASKQACESILEAYNERFGLEYTILRYGSLYGPRAQKWNGLMRFVVQALTDNKINYPGTGEERREYIHICDAALLSIKALSSEFANQCLTLTGTQIISSRDVMLMIREIVGKDIDIEFSLEQPGTETFHYTLTPYRYSSRRGRKIVPNTFIDLGQGILDMIEEESGKI
jgi:UDP-glucose 4-epimerase